VVVASLSAGRGVDTLECLIAAALSGTGPGYTKTADRVTTTVAVLVSWSVSGARVLDDRPERQTTMRCHDRAAVVCPRAVQMSAPRRQTGPCRANQQAIASRTSRSEPTSPTSVRGWTQRPRAGLAATSRDLW